MRKSITVLMIPFVVLILSVFSVSADPLEELSVTFTSVPGGLFIGRDEITQGYSNTITTPFIVVADIPYDVTASVRIVDTLSWANVSLNTGHVSINSPTAWAKAFDVSIDGGQWSLEEAWIVQQAPTATGREHELRVRMVLVDKQGETSCAEGVRFTELPSRTYPITIRVEVSPALI